MCSTATRNDRNAVTIASSWSECVARNFDSAAGEYDSFALVQQTIAEALGQWIGNHVGHSIVESGLEIGCGTGFLTRQILARWPDANWQVTDIAPDMIQRCERAFAGSGLRTQFAVDDGQTLDMPANSLDLIVSNMTFQWFADLAKSTCRLLEFLRPGGMLVFSTLGQGSFRSARQYIESAFYQYPTSAQLMRDLLSIDKTCQIESHLFQESTDNLGSLLRHLGSIGAGTPVPGHRVRPSQLRRAIRESASQATELAVEYEVLFVAMQKC